jgi:SSS family solute:Na+ symporter
VFFSGYFVGYAGIFAMLAGLIIVPAVNLLTKAPDTALVDNCFSCYEEIVAVKVRDDLGNS